MIPLEDSSLQDSCPPPDRGALARDLVSVFNKSGRKHDTALGWTVAASMGPVLGPKVSRVTLHGGMHWSVSKLTHHDKVTALTV
jgi:hypothetical protein